MLSTTKHFGQYLGLRKVDSIRVLYNPILNEYWNECQEKRCFFENKGVVKVIIFKDSLHNNCLRLSALIDDRFMDNPTNSYFFINSNLYLIYSGDSLGFELHQLTSKKLKSYLKKIVEDRVYQRPPKIDRWIEIVDLKGKVKKVRSLNLSLGNTWNDTIYIFDKNGNYTKLKSL